MAKRKQTKRTAPRPCKRSAPDWAPAFLVVLAQTANILASCQHCGISRANVYQRRDHDEAFAQAMANALEDACDLLEGEARRRALDGVDEPVIHQGELCGTWIDAAGNVVSKDTPMARLVPLTIKRYSDGLMIAQLKAHRPELYRDNVKVEHTGKGGGPIRSKVSHDVAGSLAPYASAFRAFAASVLAGGSGAVPPDGAGEPVDTPPTDSQAGAVPPS